jgi:hypothetical protein
MIGLSFGSVHSGSDLVLIFSKVSGGILGFSFSFIFVFKFFFLLCLLLDSVHTTSWRIGVMGTL